MTMWSIQMCSVMCVCVDGVGVVNAAALGVVVVENVSGDGNVCDEVGVSVDGNAIYDTFVAGD